MTNAAAILHTRERAIVYARYGRHEEADAFTTANSRAHRELACEGELTCRHCRFPADDHDFDGRCPSSEDDAWFYRMMNAPA